MNLKNFLPLCIFLLLGLTAISQDVPSGRRLREIAEDKFVYNHVFIGGATHGKLFGTNSITILNREFNYITPANDFKQTKIHPEPNKWNWDLADQWVDSARLNNQLIRMHSPISPQASKWAKDDTRTAAELELNMTEYMTELCKHFNNEPEIEWLDVVNETVNRDGTWFGPKEGVDKWENPWPLIGYDQTNDGLNPPSYIRMAFEIANQEAPDIKLIYNHHGDMEDVMWDKVKNTVLYLKSLGLRVDGIGWQAHLETDFLDDPTVITKIEALIDWAHANNLEFHVTENDVDILTGDDFTKQAEVFSTVVKAVLQKGINGVVSWNAWMVKDDDGKGADGLPTLFDTLSVAKPAYYAIQQVLEELNHEAELTVSITGNGNVSVTNQTYLRNSSQTITATPLEGYVFLSWGGDIASNSNPLSIVMDSNKNITAVFTPLTCQNIEIIATATNTTCFGIADGEIAVSITGGSEPYTISWSTGQNTENISELSAGFYTATVTDSEGCINNATIEIKEPSKINVVARIVDSSSTSGNGFIDITVTGGVPDYSYSWNTGLNTEDISRLSPGVYTLDITDNNDCMITESFEITGVTGFEKKRTNTITIYPNPASNYLQIDYSGIQNIVSYKLINLNGICLKQGILTSSAHNLDITTLPAGQYILLVNDGINPITKNIIKSDL